LTEDAALPRVSFARRRFTPRSACVAAAFPFFSFGGGLRILNLCEPDFPVSHVDGAELPKRHKTCMMGGRARRVLGDET
jgi:hypothetical protein